MRRGLRHARLGTVALTMFLDLLGFGIIIPLMPHYAESFGATPMVYGLLAASYSLMQFLCVPIWGRLSDQVGRRPVLLISIGGSVLSFLLLAAADSLGSLFLARILSGISTSNLSVAQAYVADVTRPEERARGMGMIGAAFGLGFVVGPFVGGELSQVALPLAFGWSIGRGSAPFVVAALLSALNWVLAFSLLPESLPKDRIGGGRRRLGAAGQGRAGESPFALARLRRVLHHRQVTGLFGVSFLATVAFSMMEQSLILFGERRVSMTEMGAGRLLGFVGVLVVLVQGGMVGRLVRRFGEERLTVSGAAIMIAGLLLVPVAHGYRVLALAMVPLALGSGLLHPSLHALISRRSAEDEQGGVLGLNQSLSSLARVLGPSGGGWLFQTVGIGAPFLFGAAVMTGAACLAVVAAAPFPPRWISAAKTADGVHARGRDPH